jgi:hypothetical protein
MIETVPAGAEAVGVIVDGEVACDLTGLSLPAFERPRAPRRRQRLRGPARIELCRAYGTMSDQRKFWIGEAVAQENQSPDF